MLRRVLSASMLSLALAGVAQAQSSLTINRTLVAGGVSYANFTVTTAGTFDLWTTSILGTAGTTPFDPYMYLFAGLGTGGALLGSNDDGCFNFLTQCGPSATFNNAILDNIALGTGDYTIAVGAFSLSEEEARSGVNAANTGEGDFAIRIASLQEFGGGNGVANVPEPSTSLIVAAGLAGLGIVSRRRRQR